MEILYDREFQVTDFHGRYERVTLHWWGGGRGRCLGF